MTTDSQFNDHSRLQFNMDLSDGKSNHANESTGAMDMVKRDRFELLSAYLDGEVTAVERKQVEEWLANDAAVQQLYARLLKLRQGLRTMPVPQAQQPIEETVQKVMARVRRRTRLAWVCGGTALAATIIGAVSGLIPSGDFGTPQMAQNSIEQQTQNHQQKSLPGAGLMLAINGPIMPIPKAAEASEENNPPLNQQKQLQQLDIKNDYH